MVAMAQPAQSRLAVAGGHLAGTICTDRRGEPRRSVTGCSFAARGSFTAPIVCWTWSTQTPGPRPAGTPSTKRAAPSGWAYLRRDVRHSAGHRHHPAQCRGMAGRQHRVHPHCRPLCCRIGGPCCAPAFGPRNGTSASCLPSAVHYRSGRCNQTSGQVSCRRCSVSVPCAP